MNEESLFARRSKATAATLAVELLDDHFNGAQAKFDAEIFRKLDQGLVITPEEALQFIFMKHAHHKLCKMLASTLQQGRSANSQLAPLLNGATDA